MAVDANVRFCPSCGSPSVDFKPLAGARATCNACGWTGTTETLLITPFQHELGDDNAVMEAFTTQFKNVLARSAGVDLGRLFVKWGFVSSKTQEEMRVELARYLAAMARGAVTAVLEERRKMAIEPKAKA